ncbi:MAG: lipocalin-like domain-containing protein [Pseudomonadota bacterium]|nr:lipocalin-like domain-containing protein [Pseudomonadota bacterium]
MIKRLLWVSLGLLVNSAVGATDDIDTIRQKFIGDWELASYYTFPANGSEREMGYIGRLSYDRFGNMAGLGMPKDLPKRQRESNERLMQGFAYWGPVSWDLERGTVIHHVQGSPMVPQWVGGDNVRYFEFEGNDILKLSLRDNNGRTTATLTWHRLK